MTDYELICDVIQRIIRMSKISNAVSFSYNIDSSIEIFIKGRSYVVFDTLEEVYAFLDGLETSLEQFLKR